MSCEIRAITLCGSSGQLISPRPKTSHAAGLRSRRIPDCSKLSDFSKPASYLKRFSVRRVTLGGVPASDWNIDFFIMFSAYMYNMRPRTTRRSSAFRFIKDFSAAGPCVVYLNLSTRTTIHITYGAAWTWRHIEQWQTTDWYSASSTEYQTLQGSETLAFSDVRFSPTSVEVTR